MLRVPGFSGYNADSEKKYYEGILYDFTGTTSKKKRNSVALGSNTNREPTLITSGADYTWNILANAAKGYPRNSVTCVYQKKSKK